MVQRFRQKVLESKSMDRTYMLNNNHFLSGVGNKELDSNTIHQQLFPEYDQQSYLRLRSIEEAYATYNYYDVDRNPLYQEICSKVLSEDAHPIVDPSTREFGMTVMFHLHSQKKYRIETLFLAASIFDRYQMLVGPWFIRDNKVVHLATACMLLAAKITQPMSPSFQRMFVHLSEDDQKHVSKEVICDLEYDIICRFGWDFNFQNPCTFIERYLPYIEVDIDKCNLKKDSIEFCKMCLQDHMFLDYQPSIMAACSLILAANIEKYDVMMSVSEDLKLYEDCLKFFAINEDDELTNLKLNTHIWTTPKLVTISGYLLKVLLTPLHLMAKFLKEEVLIGQLQNFDVEAIRLIKE